MNLNQSIFAALFNLAHKSPILDAVIVFLALYLTYFLVASLAIWVFRIKGEKKRIFILSEIFISLILARGIITEAVRFFYYHPRPFDALGFASLIPESGASFPSGHMTFLFSLGIVLFFYDRKFSTWFMGLSFLVGVARIFAGVHWPLDILGGIIIGALCGLLIHKIFKPYLEKLETPEILEPEENKSTMENPQ